MSDNELAILEKVLGEEAAADIASEMGVQALNGSRSGYPNIQLLDDEDHEYHRHLHTYVDGKRVYAKTIQLRPFLLTFKRATYDATKVWKDGKGTTRTGQYTHETVMGLNNPYKEELIDSQGTVNCGIPTSWFDGYDKLTDAQKKKVGAAKLQRIIFGTMSMEGMAVVGKDDQGREVYEACTLTDVPVQWRVTSSTTGKDIRQYLTVLGREKKYPFNVALTIDSKRSKNQSGIKYLHMTAEIDKSAQFTLTEEDAATFGEFKKAKDTHNTMIKEAHNAILKQKSSSADDALEAEFKNITPSNDNDGFDIDLEADKDAA